MEQNTLDIFDRFYSNGMTEEEATEFLATLEKDPGLKRQFGEFLAAVEGINLYEREKLKNLLRATPVRRLSARRLLLATAAIILLLIIPGVLLYRYMTASDRLYSKYYFHDPGMPITMGGATANKWDEAMSEYKMQNYTAAAGLLDNILQAHPGNDTALYYLGLCQHEMKLYGQSISTLSQLQENSAFYHAAFYNTALSYLRLQKYDKAREAAEKASACEQCPFTAKAAGLSEELK